MIARILSLFRRPLSHDAAQWRNLAHEALEQLAERERISRIYRRALVDAGVTVPEVKKAREYTRDQAGRFAENARLDPAA